jgi:hypothetical protein
LDQPVAQSDTDAVFQGQMNILLLLDARARRQNTYVYHRLQTSAGISGKGDCQRPVLAGQGYSIQNSA